MLLLPAGRYRAILIALALAAAAMRVSAQDTTSGRRLTPVVVTAGRPLHVIGHLPALHEGVVMAGKKNEFIVIDSLRANIAADIERQILGRVPGAHFSETAGAGFPSNGVGFRGLDPTQSVEMNVRQNGVNIAADLFGYPEAYYTPPTEALQRIDVIRGAASLAFGPQFGGVVNYVVRDGALNAAPRMTTSVTGGSFGFLDSFASLGGGSARSTYYAFLDGRRSDGWRPNSDYRQLTAFGKASRRVNDRLSLSAEYTLFRNRIHMPGGLSDSAFAIDPRLSLRARNWLESPWNIGVARLSYQASKRVSLESALSLLDGSRALVWRNEDGGPGAQDLRDPATNEFVPREVERETFRTVALESRVRVDHRIASRQATLSAGFRASRGGLHRFEGGEGSTGADFDLRLVAGAEWERALRLRTTNLAAFAEELLQVTDRLSVVPGIRLESVRSTASGYTDVTSSFSPRRYTLPLGGVGLAFITTPSTELYANVAQAYRPILYASLTPLGSITRVNPALHASRGYNADMGWRGTIGSVLKFDVGTFYLRYRDRIGTRAVTDGDESFSEIANIGTSVHRGVESYLEVNPLRLVGVPSGSRDVDLFASVAYVDAKYVSGGLSGNRVELAPRVLARVGAGYAIGRLSGTLQLSHTSRSFGDATNSVTPTDDATAGVIPAYAVADWSGAYALPGGSQLTFGINNLSNTRYFTKRTGEYPGPGILPGQGRSAYTGLKVAF